MVERQFESIFPGRVSRVRLAVDTRGIDGLIREYWKTRQRALDLLDEYESLRQRRRSVRRRKARAHCSAMQWHPRCHFLPCGLVAPRANAMCLPHGTLKTGQRITAQCGCWNGRKLSGWWARMQISVTGSRFGDWGLQRFGSQQKKVRPAPSCSLVHALHAAHF